MSTLQVENLIGPTSGSNANKVIIPSGQTLYAPGHVIQVVNAVTTTLFNTTSSSYVDMNLQASITPLSASSKILVVANINVGIYASSYLAYPKFKILRGSTTLSDTEKTHTARADQVGNFQHNVYNVILQEIAQ